VVDAENLIRQEILNLSKKQAVKIDCRAAIKEVNKYHDKNNTRNLWVQWQNSAKTCLQHTIKLKIGLFCAICSPLAYTGAADIFVPQRNEINATIRTSQNDCNKFVTDCHAFIAAQMNIREYFSAVAALSKCDERGWTDFDQEYLYRPQNKTIKDLLDEYKNNLSMTPTDRDQLNQRICEAEYSLSTMLASDLKEKRFWLSFVQNTESIFKKFNIKNDSPKYFYQADDENSVKQDLSDYQVKVSGTSFSILHYFENGTDGMASRVVNEEYVAGLVSSSKIFSLVLASLVFALICSF